MSLEQPRKVSFFEFELDLDSGDLSRNGRPVRLAAQPSRALVLLVQRAGQLVLRPDIQQQVWGDLVIEQEQGLNTCIRQIRAALDDRSDSPRFIETVPRRGYRFIAPVLPVTKTATTIPRSVTTANSGLGERAATKPQPPARRFFSAGRLLAIVLILGLVAWLPSVLRQWLESSRSLADPSDAASSTVRALTRESGSPAAESAEEQSPRSMIAVLPFLSVGGGDEEQAFALGLTEEITTELARLDPERLGVISRASATRYADAQPDLGRIARELGVGSVLQGSVRRMGDTARIAVQLVRVEDHSHLWAERYDRPLADVLEVQLEIARRVAKALVPELLPWLRDAPAVAPGAWEAYLRGRHLLDSTSPTDTAKARAELQRALELDPRLAQAHVALAKVDHIERGPGNLARQRANLEAALEIDPDLAQAHLSMGKLQLYFEWDFAAAGRSFARALELAPGDATVHQGYALYLSSLRQHDKAIAHIERARQLDPISASVHWNGGDIYFSARRYEEAVEVCGRTLELAPDHFEARSCMLQAQSRLGRHSEARRHAVEMMRRLGATEAELQPVADDEDLDRALQRFFVWQLAWLQDRGAPPVVMAAAVLPLGRVDEVFLWLERAYEQRSPNLLAIAADPRADAFREDPRFVDLLHRVGFPADTIER